MNLKTNTYKYKSNNINLKQYLKMFVQVIK